MRSSRSSNGSIGSSPTRSGWSLPRITAPESRRRSTMNAVFRRSSAVQRQRSRRRHHAIRVAMLSLRNRDAWSAPRGPAALALGTRRSRCERVRVQLDHAVETGARRSEASMRATYCSTSDPRAFPGPDASAAGGRRCRLLERERICRRRLRAGDGDDEQRRQNNAPSHGEMIRHAGW